MTNNVNRPLLDTSKPFRFEDEENISLTKEIIFLTDIRGPKDILYKVFKATSMDDWDVIVMTDIYGRGVMWTEANLVNIY